MWRTGVVVLLFFAYVQLSSAGLKNDVKILERIKRSPQYCGPYWPPRPPPHWHHHHKHAEEQAEAAAIAQAEAAAAAQAAASAGGSAGGSAQSQAISAGPVTQGGNTGYGSPCTTCGGRSGSTAESNANSVTGDAIAVAIAKRPD